MPRLNPKSLPHRVGIIQRVSAYYRRPFFEKLAAVKGIGLSVLAGKPAPGEGLRTVDTLKGAQLWPARNRYFPIGHGSVCWQGGMHRWLDAFDPSILVMSTNPRLIASRQAIRWMRRRRRPVLGWGLGKLPHHGPAWVNWGRKLITNNLLHKLDGIIAYSSKAARDYEDAGIDRKKIFIAHNAVDNSESENSLTKFGEDDSWIKPWKERMGLSAASPIILFVGRLLPQKRVDLLIEACAPLFPHCQLLIVGDGPQMQTIRTDAKPHERYIKFAGHLTGTDLGKCFIAADLFVLPGLGGLAIHQAMSYGKPVLVSFGDGTESDLVREGFNGVRFQPGDAQDMRAKIAPLLGDREKLSRMGKASLSMIREEMNLNSMVGAFHKALVRTADLHAARSSC